MVLNTEVLSPESNLLPAETSVKEAAMTERQRAEVESAMTIAKRFPRDEHKAFTSLMKSLQRPKLAEAAQYRFPRGGKEVTGASVALCRAIAAAWGNIQYGLEILDSSGDTVHICGYAWDIETNARVQMLLLFSASRLLSHMLPRLHQPGLSEGLRF